MNWTPRINAIVKQMFPIETDCILQIQMALRARIARGDRIKRELAGKTINEQEEIIKGWESKINVQ